MDQDIKPILAEIAEQLKIRNDLIQRQREEAAKLMPSFGEDFEKRMERSRELTMALGHDHEKAMEEIRKESHEHHEEDLKFRASLLAELSSLNANFARLLEHLKQKN